MSSKATIASTVADDLRHRIVCGELRPDEKLNVARLADGFGVTLSPVREALNRLISEGLVQLRDMRGFSVSPVSIEELDEITRTRIWLTEVALRQSIAHGDEIWLESLVLSHYRLQRTPRMRTDKPGSGRAWDEAHRIFHRALTAGCRSRPLVTYCDQLFIMADRYRHLARSSPQQRGRQGDEEHQRILDAVIARDADGAVRLMAKHFETTAAMCRALLVRSATKVTRRQR